MRSDEIQAIIKKGFKNYRVKQVSISDKPYDLHVFSEDEDLNLFEGFLFTEIIEKSELFYLKSRYRAPVSGYVPRLSFLSYKNQLIIKDYRKNRHIQKTFQKINKSFISKLKKALTDPGESNFNKLFDRTDIIEEFWILYKKSRDHLLENIKGISDEDERIAFVDNLMMQMLTLWYLQEKRFFDGDISYFITKFKDMGQKKLFGGFKNYYEFLTHFFEIIGNNVGNQYHEDDTLGKVVVLGPAIFLNGNIDQAAITIPDRCFYKEGMTDTLINTPPKKAGADIPLFNLFESRDWTEGNIDDFVLGAIYEKLITHIERKKLGAYYTPEAITEYICKNTIEPYLIDKVNCETGNDFKSIDEIVGSNDKAMLLRLFDSLKEIKILDPAVGSAHFLADAIEVLLGVYEKIWDMAKESGLRRGLGITAADEGGRLKNINLLEISDRDQFKIYIKFFIILSKNIYGVDINQSAINVARARLFLSIAKHFDAGKGCFIRFPNVHFNLRTGNSLIGYVGMGEDSEVKQSTFDMFVGEQEAVYAAEPIKVVSELGDYLSETARTLGMDGDILEEIRGLNGILSMKRIGWGGFERVLRVKEKLIRILIVSLNSEHAMPLNGLIKSITALFGGKLDERFAREHEIDLDALEEIGTFHWGMEFPEVFLTRGGFDVVVGNPPYVSYGLRDVGKLTSWEKELIKTLFESAEYKISVYPLFIERSIELSREKGYHSLIVPDSFLLGRYFSKVRKIILRTCEIKNISFLSFSVFVGSTVGRSVIYVFHKNLNPKQRLQNQLKAILFKDIDKIANNRGEVYEYGQPYFLNTDFNRFQLFFREDDFEIVNQILEKCKCELGNIMNFSSGLIGKKGKEEIVSENKEDDTWKLGIISGEQMGRFWIEKPSHYILFDINKLKSGFKDAKYDEPKILMRQTGDEIIAACDRNNLLCLNNLHVGNFINPSYDMKSVLSILNSKLMTWYYRKTTLEEGRTMAQTDIETVEKLPMHDISEQIGNVLTNFANCLLLLNTTEDGKTQFEDIIEFFNRQIVDFLVYELYFHEKFHEDGLYPEPKEYLSELVSKHLKPISYDRWAELHWKKQLEENLTPEEEKELGELETENTKTIESVHDAITNDREIQQQIKKIRMHEWIKIIDSE